MVYSPKNITSKKNGYSGGDNRRYIRHRVIKKLMRKGIKRAERVLDLVCGNSSLARSARNVKFLRKERLNAD